MFRERFDLGPYTVYRPFDCYGEVSYSIGRALAHDRLWFRRFIPVTALMPAPAVEKPRVCIENQRRIRQERANHAQRRAALRRRFVQELAK